MFPSAKEKLEGVYEFFFSGYFQTKKEEIREALSQKRDRTLSNRWYEK